MRHSSESVPVASALSSARCHEQRSCLRFKLNSYLRAPPRMSSQASVLFPLQAPQELKSEADHGMRNNISVDLVENMKTRFVTDEARSRSDAAAWVEELTGITVPTGTCEASSLSSVALMRLESHTEADGLH